MTADQLKKEYLELTKASFDKVFGGNARKARMIVGRILRERGYYWSDNYPFGEIPIRENAPVSKRKARVILHHGKVRGRKLTAKQRRYFGARASGYPVRNPKKKLVLIYGAVLSIDARKTQPHQCDKECIQHGHNYRHKFSSKPHMYGLPNGDILIS